jgi:hypothetical protein
MFGRSGRDLALVAIFESIFLLGVLSSSVIASAASVDFPPTDFKVLSADGMVVLGRAHFKLAAQSGGRALVEGKYQFTNGEYDVDEDWLELQPHADLPTLLSYRHAFFHADGSLDRVNEANLKSGQASCTIYVNGKAETQKADLAFSADTYAGPAVTLPIRKFIRGSMKSVEFRDFSCTPGPKIYLVRASIEQLASGRSTQVNWFRSISSPI